MVGQGQKNRQSHIYKSAFKDSAVGQGLSNENVFRGPAAESDQSNENVFRYFMAGQSWSNKWSQINNNAFGSPVAGQDQNNENGFKGLATREDWSNKNIFWNLEAGLGYLVAKRQTLAILSSYNYLCGIYYMFKKESKCFVMPRASQGPDPG